MSKPLLILSMQGRFGNCAIQYLFCRAFADERGYELRMDPWIGEQVFEISHPRPDIGAREAEVIPTVNELTIFKEQSDRTIIFRGYAQMQHCVDLYTKRKAQQWLSLRSTLFHALGDFHCPQVVAHRRVGDYIGYSLPVVSEQSYRQACTEWCIDTRYLSFASEENPLPRIRAGRDDISFMVDFYCMMNARVLLRANSTFSWLAGLLGRGIVLSPVIDGLVGGKEHDNVSFVPGNWPRLQNLDFTTEMRVRDI